MVGDHVLRLLFGDGRLETSTSPQSTGTILRTGIDSTGFERTPMRNAEARITLGVISAREGELALDYGRQVIAGERLSVPSLLMVSAELATIVSDRYPTDPSATDYLDQLKHLRSRAVPRCVA